MSNKQDNRYRIIDLFAGVGGIRLGFQNIFQSKAEFVFSSEIDKYAKITYQTNYNDTPDGDITQIDAKDIPAHDIILAGFPCQAFSVAGLRKGFEDTRGTLFFDVARIAKYHKPKVIFLENVKGFRNHDKGNTFKVVKKTLEDLGYSVFSKVLNAKEFGVPQNRERIYIIAFLDKDMNFEFPTPLSRDVKLGHILEKDIDEKYTISDKLWAGHQRRKKEHKKKGNGFGYSMFNEESKYTSTISARYYKDGSEILIEQKDKNPRKLTPREAGRLQGFPDSFKIPVSDTQAYKQFGNSVAVSVIEELAKKVLKGIEEMSIEKLNISKDKFDINLKFYFFLKYLVKTKLTDKQSNDILKISILNSNIDFKVIRNRILEYIENSIKVGSKKQKLIFEVVDKINSDIDLKLFIFSLKLYMIKDLLLQEAKLKDLLDTSKLQNLDPLSLEYDKITIFSPYSTRVNGALLSLLFFDKLEKGETNLISKEAEEFIIGLSKFAIELRQEGVEPNQIFMLMFNESINQSIISDSGSNYEERILNVLLSIGLDESKIKKIHDKDDSSTEFDFFFELEDKTYGIGAKRTLRERYKQFIKTAQMSQIDVMIEITLGIDLTLEKVKAIRNHNIFLFVSDEVYQSNQYLKEIKGVYSSKDLTLKTLKNLRKI